MGEIYFTKLLERLDKAFPKEVKEDKLIEEGFDKTILSMCKASKLIYCSSGDDYILSAEGFLLLNQIRMKKSLEVLDNSIKDFDESSIRLSTRMYWLTWAMFALTLALFFIGLIQIKYKLV